jgi:hypothetical protein
MATPTDTDRAHRFEQLVAEVHGPRLTNSATRFADSTRFEQAFGS